MADSDSDPIEMTYPLRAAARITGLSPELLRAWERRYQVVVPMRTPGGTRRYRAADLEKLRLVKAAVDAGHRISRVAQMDEAELARSAQNLPAGPTSRSQVEEILQPLERLDAAETQRLLSLQLSALGPVRFARQIARPLVHTIGDMWERGDLSIAAEHMASSVLRAMFGAALQPTAANQLGPRVLFATPSQERHEMGLQMAALTAMGAGANVVYLGPEMPVEDLVDAVERTDSVAVALSIVTMESGAARTYLTALRKRLPDAIHVWIGGEGARGIELAIGVDTILGLDEFERRISLLGYEASARESR